MTKDLHGLLVVAVEQAVAAPYASGRLADAGARVIKIERPEGDFARNYDTDVNGESAYFVWLNKGKESLRLDLRQDDDKALLHRILAKADIFIQNLAPGAIGRLGFSPAALRKQFPRLITCSISGYGDDGPYRDMKAYDLLIQAESGLSDITGNQDGRARVGVSVCDIAAGMTAFQAILQALIGRERNGEGRDISVSLFHALADWMNVPYLQFKYGNRVAGRTGLNHPTIAPYGDYVCGDGKSILLSVQNDREWRSFCEIVLNDPVIADDERFLSNNARVLNRAAVDDLINQVFGTAKRDEIVEKLALARIAYGRISSLEDLAAHPQNRFVTIETASGPVKILAPGAKHDGEFLAASIVPTLGAHDEMLRSEFGEQEIA